MAGRKSVFFVRRSILLIFFCVIFFSVGFLFRDFIMNRLENFYISPLGKDAEIQIKALVKKNKTLETFKNLKNDLISQKIPSLLEINFPEMKVRFWENGGLKKEVNISARGDVAEWGGTAAGLYSIISKNKLAFSGIANVYMPYAINFYGKYYIHGIPYYSDGGKRIVNITGGCVQLSDDNAKEIFDMAKEDMPVIVIDKYNDNYDGYAKNKKNTAFPTISAESYLVADLDSGTVLAEKNIDNEYPIASLTKLMTAVIISERIDLRKYILVTEDMLKPFGSTNGLVAGKKFNVVELFYPTLIESSNDAAEVLSNFIGNKKTIQLMNEKTKSLIMENTAFVDVHGFDPNNISTAKDLFYLSRYILNNRSPVWEITKGEKVNLYGQMSFNKLNNKNIFYDDENFLGGKTGYIKASNYNGIFLMNFSKGDTKRRIAIIILGDPNLFYGQDCLKTNTQKIIDWVNYNYF